jgi:uroporphyrinogen decarboxylase
MAEMTRRERIAAALKGQPVDRPPVAFWRHWPVDDQSAEALADRTLEYRKRFDFDLIKVTPSSSYCIEDYGAKTAYQAAPIGERTYLERVIKKAEDWDKIEPVDVRKGAYGRVLEALRITLAKRGDDTPVIQTMFNPLGMARMLAGDDKYVAYVRREPERLKRALAALEETCVNFAKAAIDADADGIFLSTFAASFDIMSEPEYRELGRPADIRILEASAKGRWFNLMHLHGWNPMFEVVKDYPVAAMNWHDRAAGPSLSAAAKLFKGAVVGGVEQYQTLQFGTPDDVRAQVNDAIKQMNGRRLIVAAGCTYPPLVPEGNLIAAVRAVKAAAKP